ncbi:MAG: dynamin family protein [Sulfurospirillaceae bacterium]|nr:dynamin family protein [Sulfurospirillaceae bacterium]
MKKILKSFIKHYQELNQNTSVVFDENLVGFLKKAKHLLLDEAMRPSLELKEALNRLKMRAEEPMKVAIVGQFSSGKSTFLNALLAQKILPTGITPVTSKVNYIRYADEIKIRIRYKDGRDEYRDISSINRFTDQRGEVEDIAYLTLYAPLEMLKDIVFVDTPGLNSQVQTDTQTTKTVLQEVDGIIWLSLMDNAGKLSEVEALKDYLGAYQNKSLCVLNQKDRFTDEQIESAMHYVKGALGEFFSDIVAISASQALESRSHDKMQLAKSQTKSFLKQLEEKMGLSPEKVDDALLCEAIYEHKQKMKDILQQDLSENIRLLELSNISKVLTFINDEIRPRAMSAKEFAITKETKHIAQMISSQHELLMSIYDELLVCLDDFQKEAQSGFYYLQEHFSKQLKNAFFEIETIIEVIAQEIFKQIKTFQRIRYSEQKKGLLKSKKSYMPIAYEAPKIESDSIYKVLFYDDNLIGKMFKQYVKNLNTIQDEVNHKNREIYQKLEEKVRQWQIPYENIRKNEAIYSDLEFANMRKFASKVYENILKPFNDETLDSYAKVSSHFNHLSSAVSFNYQNATEVCVAFLENKIEKSVQLYEQNPTKFSLYSPKIEEIKDRLRTNFHLYELENMMNSRTTFLHKDYDRLIEKFKTIYAQKQQFVKEQQERHRNIIAQITDFNS